MRPDVAEVRKAIGICRAGRALGMETGSASRTTGTQGNEVRRIGKVGLMPKGVTKTTYIIGCLRLAASEGRKGRTLANVPTNGRYATTIRNNEGHSGYGIFRMAENYANSLCTSTRHRIIPVALTLRDVARVSVGKATSIVSASAGDVATKACSANVRTINVGTTAEIAATLSHTTGA